MKLFILSTWKFETYLFQRKGRSRGNRILSNTLVALPQFPRIRCWIRILQDRHSFLSNFSLMAIDRSSHRCKDFRGLVDKPRNWLNFSIIFYFSYESVDILAVTFLTKIELGGHIFVSHIPDIEQYHKSIVLYLRVKKFLTIRISISYV